MLWRVFRAESGEVVRLLLSGGYFFLVLFGYFLLRPVREAMGVQESMDDLRELFLVTCGVSLVVSVGFGGLISRMDRARFILVGHVLVACCLGVFLVARVVVTDEERLYVGYAFYVWLSVVNLYVTSVFWSFMADVWSLEQGKRLFPVIGVGGTLGALAASLFASGMVRSIGVGWQVGLSAACFLAAVPLVVGLDRGERAERRVPARAVGGSFADGVLLLVRSPYLLGTGLYVMALTISSTLLYFTRTELVSDASEELERRVSMFAQMDAWTQGATLVAQLFITGRMMRRLGVGVTLAVMPLVTVGGFGVLAWVERMEGVEGWQVFGVVTAFSAVHSAARYAVARPSRETLFSVVSAGEKYKAKPVIDVFLYRGGDVAGAGVQGWVMGLGMGLAGMMAAVLPLAVVWGGLCCGLAVAQRRRAARMNEVEQASGISDAEGVTG